jgi:hypothetical protein
MGKSLTQRILRSLIPTTKSSIKYLPTIKRQASNGDTEAETLHADLLAAQTNTTMKSCSRAERKINPGSTERSPNIHRTPGGAYIVQTVHVRSLPFVNFPKDWLRNLSQRLRKVKQFVYHNIKK